MKFTAKLAALFAAGYFGAAALTAVAHTIVEAAQASKPTQAHAAELIGVEE